MIRWTMNENITIDLPRAEVEALDSFFKRSWMGFFIDQKGQQFIRERFIADLASNKRNMIEIKEVPEQKGLEDDRVQFGLLPNKKKVKK